MSWIIRLIPSERKTLTTDASVAEVMRRLAEEVEDGGWEGELLTDSSFRLRRIQKIPASMVAVVKGHILQKDGLTYIETIVTTSTFNKALWMAVYLQALAVIVLTSALALLVSPIFALVTSADILVYLLFCAFRKAERDLAFRMIDRISAPLFAKYTDAVDRPGV